MFGFGKKKKKRDAIATQEYTIRDGDNIISLAQQYDVSWTELAALNDIVPPYVLTPGTTLRVPAMPEEDATAQPTETSPAPSARTIGTSQHYMTPSDMPPVAGDGDDAYPHDKFVDADAIGADISSAHVQRKNSLRAQSVPSADQLSDTSASDDAVSLPRDGASAYDDNGAAPHTDTTAPNRTILHASPESMIAQPSSEPTTRAIDIEWMRDDEEAYAEEMHRQQKRTGRWLGVTVFAIAAATIAAAVCAYMYFVPQTAKDRVSLEALIRGDAPASDVSHTEEPATEHSAPEEQTTQPVTETPPQEQQETPPQNDVAEVSPADVTVQVLNAGGPAGAAGSVTTVLKEKKFVTRTAQNAKNTYTGTVVYYASGKKDAATAVVTHIPATYGTPQIEESSDVTTTYDAMVVVVIGASR